MPLFLRWILIFLISYVKSANPKMENTKKDLEAKISSIETKISSIEKRIEKIESDIDYIKKSLDPLRDNVISVLVAELRRMEQE